MGQIGLKVSFGLSLLPCPGDEIAVEWEKVKGLNRDSQSRLFKRANVFDFKSNFSVDAFYRAPGDFIAEGWEKGHNRARSLGALHQSSTF